MGRTVISRRDVLRSGATLGAREAAPKVRPDQYTDRLIKYIPPDVIVGYTAMEGMVGSWKAPTNRSLWAWLVFGTILIATPVYLYKLGNVRKPLQVTISTVAFVVWALAYPAPPFRDATSGPIATLILALYTFLIPLFTVD
jgi:hypothetical protein